MSAGICSLTVTLVITPFHGGSALGCPQTEVLLLSKSVCVGVSSSMVTCIQRKVTVQCYV